MAGCITGTTIHTTATVNTVIHSVEGQQFVLRDMAVNDVGTVASIEASATAFPWSLKNFEDCLHAKHQASVLCNQHHEIIGFVITQKVVDECHLLNICISPNYQRQGLGRGLLEQVIDLANQKGLSLIVLEVRKSNQKAQHLYSQMGFNEMAVRPNYYPSHEGREDAILMGYDIALASFFGAS